MLHDCWAYTGHCSHYVEHKCYKWKTCCEKCKRKKDYPVSWLLNNSKNNFLKKKRYFTLLDKEQLEIVVPSKWLKNETEKSFLKKYKVRVF